MNAKATSDNKEYAYFVHTKTGFANMQEVFDAFDEAYDKSFVIKKSFASNYNDLVGRRLLRDKALCSGFKQANNGKEQTKFAASTVLSEQKDLYGVLTKLKSRDYDLR